MAEHMLMALACTLSISIVASLLHKVGRLLSLVMKVGLLPLPLGPPHGGLRAFAQSAHHQAFSGRFACSVLGGTA